MSANSLEEIYNRVIVTGETPAGEPVRVVRGGLDDASRARPSNPGFEIDTAGWTPATGTITRDTGIFDTGVASGRVATDIGGSAIIDMSSFSPSARTINGHLYKATVRLRRLAACTSLTVSSSNGDPLQMILPLAALPANQWVTITYTFVARSTAELRLHFSGQGPASTNIFYIDNLSTYGFGTTLPDRRGFQRTKILPVKSALPSDLVAATKIGDTYLTGHKSTPFKGKLSVTGHGGVRRVLGGQGVHPAHLLLGFGELVRFGDRIDPDTGGVGRDGRMVNIEYRQSDQAATIEIDNRRGNFEALLERLAVVNGGG